MWDYLGGLVRERRAIVVDDAKGLGGAEPPPHLHDPKDHGLAHTLALVAHQRRHTRAQLALVADAARDRQHVGQRVGQVHLALAPQEVALVAGAARIQVLVAADLYEGVEEGGLC